MILWCVVLWFIHIWRQWIYSRYKKGMQDSDLSMWSRKGQHLSIQGTLKRSTFSVKIGILKSKGLNLREEPTRIKLCWAPPRSWSCSYGRLYSNMHEKLKAVSKFVNVLFLRGKNLPFTPLGGDSNSVMSRWQFITSTNQVMRQLLQVYCFWSICIRLFMLNGCFFPVETDK